MNKHLQTISDFIQQNEKLSAEEKDLLIKEAKATDSELTISEFKLERTEKVKRTTAILLEETIEELEQKRKSVEAQNKELEIETRLERVRAIALSMNAPSDMLEVCRVIAKELDELGVKEIRNVQTAIFYESSSTYINYEYYFKHDKTIITETSYTNHDIHRAFADQMLKGKGEYFSTHLNKAELTDWIAYQKTTNVFIDTFLESASSLNYYWFSLGPVALGISTYLPLSEEDIKLFNRFLKVFELAYRRFLDIEQALLQAKEARIETALERVRAVTMAMRKSEELISVCEVMYKQLITLGFTNIRNAQIAIKNDARQAYTVCEYSDHLVVSMKEAPYNSSPIIQTLYKELDSSDNALYQKEFTGKDFEDWRKWRQSLTTQNDERLERAQSMCFYLYSIGIGHLGISTFDAITAEQLEILKRFRNVFELCYRRYMDVAQAEAQAREAKIEAALEKVRSRSMAMHNTSELQGVIHTVHQELLNLNISISGGSFIAINSEIQKELRCWGSGGTANTSEEVHLPLYEKPFCTNLINGIKNGPGFFTEAFTQNEKKDFFTFLFKHKPWSELDSQQKIETLSSPGGYTRSCCVSQHTSIFIINHFGEIFSASDNDILKRFGKVFEQTYTRFLDLQKSEAQAREAQIELALERVRARTMAMQKSEELSDTAYELFQQFKELGENPHQITIGIIKEAEGLVEFNITGADGSGAQINRLFKFDINEPALIQKLVRGWKENKRSSVIELAGKDLTDWVAYRNSISGITDNTDYSNARRYVGVGYFSKGLISISTIDTISIETGLILERFAQVFDQTYTRFLDLQKAEAQAREAQIQLALERVRARTMAMQKSQELPEISALLFQQVKELGVTAIQNSIGIVNEETGFVELSTTIHGSHLLHTLNVPIEDPYVMAKAVAAWKAKFKSLTLEFEGQELKKYNELRNSFLQRKVSFPEDQWIVYISFFSKGWLSFSTDKNVTGEIIVVLKRFADVFEQTYTRFLDLQKAEAQAREGQIELSLERVRSRAMAMQKSDELTGLVDIVFKELTKLHFTLDRCIIIIIDEQSASGDYWMANPELNQTPRSYHVELRELPYLIATLNAWKERQPKWIYDLKGTDKTATVEYIFSKTELMLLPEEAKKGMMATERIFLNSSFSNFGGLQADTLEPISEESLDILYRFSKVFDQTYTRFLDLQKAEAQARESKIEAALERTRTQSMIMQHSDELENTLRVFHEQVQLLGINPAFSFLWLPDEEKEKHIFWAIWEEHLPSGFTLPVDGQAGKNDSIAFKNKAINYPLDRNEPATRQCLIDWKSDKPVVTYSVPPEGVENYFAAWQELIEGVETLKPEHFRNGLYYVEAFMKYGCFGVMIENDLTEDEKKILGRFSIEFERTYTRFLDLQKAEAQAREAQIQLALERVRARTMAMHKGEELADTAILLFDQLSALGIKQRSCGFLIMDEKSETMADWSANLNPGGKATIVTGTLSFNQHPILAGVVQSWKKREPYF
ncbi:MAG: hypothetical protein ABJA57_12830, partial [Ginsengibacter sp.]